MDLLAAIKREEQKLEKELSKLQNQLSGIRAAAKALGSRTRREVTEVKKRVMSAAARAQAKAITSSCPDAWLAFKRRSLFSRLTMCPVWRVQPNGGPGPGSRGSGLPIPTPASLPLRFPSFGATTPSWPIRRRG